MSVSSGSARPSTGARAQLPDVVVVGAGLIGLCTAFELVRAGMGVTIVDRSAAGSGASRGNAGEITPLGVLPLAGPGMIGEMLRGVVSRRGPLSIDPRSIPALVPFGAGFLRACLRSGVVRGTDALTQLAHGVLSSYDELEAAGVELEGGGRGFLFTDADPRRLVAAREQAARRAELLGLEAPGPVLRGGALHEHEPALRDSVPCGYVAPSERYVDPGRFVDGLIGRLRRSGATFVEHAEVTGLSTVGASAGTGGLVRADLAGRDPIFAPRVVVAAGAWSSELMRRSGVRLPIAPGKGYSFTVPTDAMPRGLVHSASDRVVAIPSRTGCASSASWSSIGATTRSIPTASTSSPCEPAATSGASISRRARRSGSAPAR
ncbi:NAD(P)/FAD-dependent oxidoreductase [Leucobacter soli]|uniref:NAD(P)/FAD-dependent oxidoreductase n=1 Tax=Leucobacter soli TaxID=2812850 RepID=UPI003622A4CC